VQEESCPCGEDKQYASDYAYCFHFVPPYIEYLSGVANHYGQPQTGVPIDASPVSTQFLSSILLRLYRPIYYLTFFCEFGYVNKQL